MTRYVVPAVLLLGLIGGYVVGQQPVVSAMAASAQAPQVGRFVPTASGRILDTTNGTLYASSDFQWTTVVSFGSQSRSNALTTPPVANRDR
jgi:hypothetical protein